MVIVDRSVHELFAQFLKRIRDLLVRELSAQSFERLETNRVALFFEKPKSTDPKMVVLKFCAFCALQTDFQPRGFVRASHLRVRGNELGSQVHWNAVDIKIKIVFPQPKHNSNIV